MRRLLTSRWSLCHHIRNSSGAWGSKCLRVICAHHSMDIDMICYQSIRFVGYFFRTESSQLFQVCVTLILHGPPLPRSKCNTLSSHRFLTNAAQRGLWNGSRTRSWFHSKRGCIVALQFLPRSAAAEIESQPGVTANRRKSFEQVGRGRFSHFAQRLSPINTSTGCWEKETICWYARPSHGCAELRRRLCCDIWQFLQDSCAGVSASCSWLQCAYSVLCRLRCFVSLCSFSLSRIDAVTFMFAPSKAANSNSWSPHRHSSLKVQHFCSEAWTTRSKAKRAFLWKSLRREKIGQITVGFYYRETKYRLQTTQNLRFKSAQIQHPDERESGKAQEIRKALIKKASSHRLRCNEKRWNKEKKCK